MAAEAANKKAEREALRGVIQQWNANRLDLFELSEPNEDLEFHGVMRFYFQDSGQKVATKCIRVASDATSQAVIETLIEKFRPDMRMLSVPEYALYEIHENGEERKLGLEEKPLLVQLNWHIDDREGRFLLRRIDDKTNAQGVGFGEGTSFRRKLSKREKKQMKKQEKLSRLKTAEQDETTLPVDQNGVAEKLYTELPETSFTRSISNPEAVMRRRRQQKLERKLQQFRSKDGGPDTGGTLKIYGEALCKDVPYKTLLLSVRDSAAQVVREMLSKYGLDKVDPQQYCLVQVNGEATSSNAHQEYILDDDECPLAILMNHPSTRGSIMFHVRRRPADYVPRKRKKKPAGKWSEFDHRYEDERLPFLLELNPDGTDIPSGAGVKHRLQPNVTEVGSERPIGPQAVQAQTLTLTGPTVMPRHCVIAFTENIVTLTPCSRDAHTYVNNQRIHQTTILQNGAIIKFGRMHTFRFIDPTPEDRIRHRQEPSRQMDYVYDRRSPDRNSQDVNSEKYRSGSGTPNDGPDSNPPSPTKSSAANPRSPTNAHPIENTHNYETTFDLDGNVETASLTSSRDSNRLSQQYDRQPRGTDPILPAVLEFLEETEEAFLHAVITDVEPSAPQFKLAPTYTLYLAARYRASTHYRPELQPTERAHRLTVMLANVATMIQRVILERYMDASSLALWLANGSELLHMLKSDRHVGAFSTRAQDILAESVQTAFASLVRCVSLELAPAMSQFMADADEPSKESSVLQIFSNTMALLRRCRVNAALTIQLFSHLFHTINATAFNALVSNGNLCVRWFGRRLKSRLNALETWAERQGLELASQCHLATIMQATHLLQAPKYNAEELATLSSTCFKLNSLQVRALLQKYQPAADEPRLPPELIENVVRIAESVADALARADGREIRLEEDPNLALALLLPEDGYSCEVIRGVPPGLAEFLTPLQRDGLCRMAPQPTSSGYWTIYMIDHHSNFRSPSAMSNRSGGFSGGHSGSHSQPEIQIIKLHKSTNGMGLSIVAAKGAGQDRLGIYIKSVVAGGAADADGRLTAGDQLLKVDGQSLVGITQEKAAEYLVRTGPIVTLEVAKQGAIYHGLATLLSQPSPVMTRAHKARPKSEQLDHPRLGDTAQPSTSYSVGNLLSTPMLTDHYQERLVDWDTGPERPQPGLPNKTLNRQNIHNSCLNIYPIDESPMDEECTWPRAQWTNKRPIPIIQEPQMFLTIPSHLDRYPPYPPPPQPNVPSNTPEARCNFYSEDKTDLTFPTMTFTCDKSHDSEAFLGIAESIPFIDQFDETSDDPQSSPEDESKAHHSIHKPNASNCCCQKHKCDEKLKKLKALQDADNLEIPNDKNGEFLSKTGGNPQSNSSQLRMHPIMPELNLDLTGLNSDPSSADSSPEKCWKSPEEIRLGCGRVAALAKHFSGLGDAGLIKFKSIKLGSSRQFVSEPDMASPRGFGCVRTTGDLSKSETDLSRVDKNVATTPEREWSMILLDIQTKSEEREEFIKREIQELKKSDEKLSVAEQQEIIKQLQEFSNLDNIHAPLYIPNCQGFKSSGISSKGIHATGISSKGINISGINSSTSLTVMDSQGQNTSIKGSMSLDNLERTSPSISSTIKINSDIDKVNKLEKYWSLKDLISTNVKTSRVTSDPVIFHEENFRVESINTDNVTIESKIFINDDERGSENVGTRECGSSPVNFLSEGPRKTKFPESFLRTRVKSRSEDRLLTTEEKEMRMEGSKSLENLGESLKMGENQWKLNEEFRRKLARVSLGQRKILDKGNVECHTRLRESKPIRKKSLMIMRKKSKSDLDISERKPTPRFERGDWVFRDFPSLEIDGNRPRRMSERDLPSRIGHETTHHQIHSSKSVPALHNVGTIEGKQQHEVFNPGYSRASSSNSVTPPVQPPPMPAMNGATSLRSRSSHNLHDPLRSGTLPPSGLVSRQQSSPNLHPHQVSNEAERFYQNLSVYRHQDAVVKQQPSPPQPEDRSLQKTLRGSQNSLNRPDVQIPRDRPISAYIPQAQAYPGQIQQQMQQPRSQSSRDIIRQEAKLQEMQEEVRRRELRGGNPQVNQYRGNYNARAIPPAGIRPARPPVGSTPNLATSPTYNYGQYGYNQYGQFNNKQLQSQYAVVPKKGDPARLAAAQGHGVDQREFEQRGMYVGGYPNGQYSGDSLPRGQNGNETQGDEVQPPVRPALPEDSGYRESPPPPPLNTSTHPLYTKQTDSGYTASMQDPPRGSYYPTSVPSQPRQYQYNATNPWQREEREKEQARRREAAKLWRDQQIAELSSLSSRTPQQEEQLRALQLERDFQKRAEEVANQQDDDDESTEIDNESAQRVQGLLRMAASQDRGNQGNLSVLRTSTRGQPLSPQPVGSQIQSTSVSLHTATSQGQQGGIYGGNDVNNIQMQTTVTSSYSSGQFTAPGKPQGFEERQRRIEELKRKQNEFDENQRKREEDIRMQQVFNKNQMHPGMLRLDNLVINGPSSPPGEAPPPPERGSSYAVMSQQSALRSNTSSASNPGQTAMKRVSFHDPNANIERNTGSGNSNPTSLSGMDTIREDPNNFINDAEILLASPKTPEGPGGLFSTATPGVIGAQEVYKDPRQKRLAEKQKQQLNAQLGEVPEKLSFKEKMKMFAMETGEDGTPRDKVKISRAQREIDNIGNPLSPNNNNNNNTNNRS
ncbi:afadin isoform X2 [Fopius arisanus]|nr:PREDICTED: afadin isoform X2 [Fopius arisanus]